MQGKAWEMNRLIKFLLNLNSNRQTEPHLTSYGNVNIPNSNSNSNNNLHKTSIKNIRKLSWMSHNVSFSSFL